MMNERIKELALQAFESTTDPSFVYEADMFVNIFAESIVKECLDIIKSNTYGSAGDYDYSYTDKCAAADERAETIYNEIQQHFGVK